MIGPRAVGRIGPRTGPAVSPVDDELCAIRLLSITVTPPNPSLALLEQLQMTATGNYADNTTRNLTAVVTWSTVNVLVALILPGGLVTGLVVGNTQIRAAFDAVVGQTNVQVTLL